MKKKNILLIFMILFTLMFTACTTTKKEETSDTTTQTQEENNTEITNDIPVTIAFRDGIPALTLAKMMDEKAIANLNYEMVASADALTAKVMNKEVDMAIVPSNFAAVAYNKNLGYKIVGTSVWGNLYMLTSNENVKSIADLKGKKITSFAKGMTPDLIMRYVLKENGIVPDTDVEIEYLAAPTEVAPIFISGDADIVIAPEPMATAITLQSEKAVRLIDFNEEVKKLGMENGYPQATLIVKTELIENHKELVDTILSNYEASIKWATENKDALGELSEMYELGVKKPAVVKGFDTMNIGNFAITDTKDYDKYFEVLKEDNPQNIGGNVPDASAYYER